MSIRPALLIPLLTFALLSCGEPQFKAVEVIPEEKRKTAPPQKETGGVETRTPAAAPELKWATLRGLNVRTGVADQRLQRVDGTIVRIAGFMVPLSDDLESVSEFLLVPSAGLCVHKPPPPQNQIVLVQMAAGALAKVDWTDAVVVSGAFHIDTVDSPFGNAAFRLSATSVAAW